jgi:hypothetical protein
VPDSWTLRPRPVDLLPAGILCVLAVALLWWLGGWIIGIVAAVVCVVYLARDLRGAQVTAEGLYVWGVLNRRMIAWDRIERIEAPGSRVTVSGANWAISLPAPRKGLFPAPDFDAQLARLRDAWRAHH